MSRGLDDEAADGETADGKPSDVSSLPGLHPDKQRPTMGTTLSRGTYFRLLFMSPIGLSSPFTTDISDIMHDHLVARLFFRSFISGDFSDLSRCCDGRMMGKTLIGQ